MCFGIVLVMVVVSVAQVGATVVVACCCSGAAEVADTTADAAVAAGCCVVRFAWFMFMFSLATVGSIEASLLLAMVVCGDCCVN